MRSLSIDYDFINPIITDNYLAVYPKTTLISTLIMFSHFIGEGFLAGYNIGSQLPLQGGDGLENHYDQLMNAEEIWLRKYSTIKFDPWWR